MEARLTLTHLAAGLEKGLREGLDLLRRLPQQVQSQALGRAGTDAGQALELIDQPGQRSGEAAQGLGASDRNLGGLPATAVGR